jgi:hypothetical protein
MNHSEEEKYDRIRCVILEKVGLRGPAKSICPSEVARQLGGDRWRDLMPDVREVGVALAGEGKIVVMQKGEVVNPQEAKGPIRYRLNSID